ncbi:unnamed protein product [Brachionus calyciflorus]|uniref:Uncharacterized protein n=1 Tax=Brachionus calyciflorus TaxID=104777 RepID=A0A814FMR0_9BILA|nr:unnamed protein product [Brachionus calyciflorus]
MFDDDKIKLQCAAHKLNFCANDLFNFKKVKRKNNNEKFYIRDYDKNGKSKDKEITKDEAERIEFLNKIKENVLKVPLNKCKKLVLTIRHSESLKDC